VSHVFNVYFCACQNSQKYRKYGQKNEIKRKNKKIRKIIIVGLSLVLRINCILKIQVQRGLYFTVFFQIQRAKVCIGMHRFTLATEA
jgi:hypothetical protein